MSYEEAVCGMINVIYSERAVLGGYFLFCVWFEIMLKKTL
jgi:hypothetical protein